MSRFIIMSAGLLGIFLLPGVIWYRQTGDLAIYFSEHVPEGQFIYVLSKLAGMYALLFIVWQVIASLATRCNLVRHRWQGSVHRWFGVLVVALSLTHFMLFTAALSIRQGYFAWGLFVPDFSDYYRTHLSLGLIGLWAMFAVLIAGVVHWRRNNVRARLIHRGYWVSITFIYFHALAVGTESQSRAGLALYGVLGTAALLFAISWLINQAGWRTGYSR